MRRRVLLLVVFSLILSACGASDPIDAAENCTELAAAVSDIGELSNDQFEAVSEKVVDLGGAAVADGNSLEFTTCTQLALDLVGDEVEQVFDDIAEGLDP